MEKLLVSIHPLYIYLDPIENAIPFITAEENIILHPVLNKKGDYLIKDLFCAVRAEGKLAGFIKIM